MSNTVTPPNAGAVREVRAFTPRTERKVAARFGIDRPLVNATRLIQAGHEGTPRWMAVRSRTIGASEISVLMLPYHPYQSEFSLWHVKHHGWGARPQSDGQERGHLMEAGIARRFAEAHPDLIVGRANGSLWSDPDTPWLTCTPDFLTIDAAGTIRALECKSDEGGEGWGWGDEDIPDHHRWQVTQQSGIFAGDSGWIARWNSRGYRDYLIGFDPPAYAAAATRARLFLDDVEGGREPEPDGHRQSGAVIRDLNPDVDPDLPPVMIPADWGADVAALKESAKHIKGEIARYDNLIRSMLGRARTGYDLTGRTYEHTFTPRRGYTVAPTTVDQVVVHQPGRNGTDV